jgi:hypothetical protein
MLRATVAHEIAALPQHSALGGDRGVHGSLGGSSIPPPQYHVGMNHVILRQANIQEVTIAAPNASRVGDVEICLAEQYCGAKGQQ